MHLAFDAKRAFQNRAGLGNYSRNLLLALGKYFPENRYTLFTPKTSDLFVSESKKLGFGLEKPDGFMKKFPSLWRSFALTNSIKGIKPDIFHGLSHEIPFGLAQSGIKSVITMHDLIFERYPQWYKPTDRFLYRFKYKYACNNADRIIAIGRQTADDLKDFWQIPETKIDIVKQGCHSDYWIKASEEQRKLVSQHYKLPSQFMLQVGTIEQRKNHLDTLKAMVTDKSGLPLVIVGKPTKYIKRLNRFIEMHKLQSRVMILSEVPFDHLPALYQMAYLSVYPSIFEGFGIPVLESIVSGTPVITTNKLCFTDAGGDAAFYVSPYRPDELAHAIDRLTTDEDYYNAMINRGVEHVKQFSPEIFARNTIEVYKKVLNSN